MKKTPEYLKIIINFIFQNKKIKKSNRINNFLKYFIYENEKKYIYLNNKISAELFDIGKSENKYFINRNNFFLSIFPVDLFVTKFHTFSNASSSSDIIRSSSTFSSISSSSPSSGPFANISFIT